MTRAIKPGVMEYLTIVLSPCSSLNLPKEALMTVMTVNTSRNLTIVIKAHNAGLLSKEYEPPRNTKVIISDEILSRRHV